VSLQDDHVPGVEVNRVGRDHAVLFPEERAIPAPGQVLEVDQDPHKEEEVADHLCQTVSVMLVIGMLHLLVNV